MNTVRGERLEILLHGGEVVEVRVIDSIEGTFTPPGNERVGGPDDEARE